MTEINLNQEATIILKERGVEAISEYYSSLKMTPDREYKPGDSYTGPLWEIMHIFGPKTYMGPIPPFETTFTVKPL